MAGITNSGNNATMLLMNGDNSNDSSAALAQLMYDSFQRKFHCRFLQERDIQRLWIHRGLIREIQATIAQFCLKSVLLSCLRR